MSEPSKVIRSFIVTGSSSGIGAALCRRLAAPGVGIVLHARHNRQGAQKVAHAGEALGAKTAITIGDIGAEATSKALVANALEHFGRLDVVVANAGIPILKSFEEGVRSDLDKAIATNLVGFYCLAREAISPLMRGTHARIISVSSLNAHVFRNDFINFPLSAASKAGIEAMTRGLAIELAPLGITVNAVVPGMIRKDQDTRDGLAQERLRHLEEKIPLGRVGEPDEVAALIEFLASKEADYITGQLMHVNGGII